MAAAKGNKYAKGNQSATKLKTPQLKKQAYEQYCSWIALGHSKESWTFKHSVLSLTSKTMEKYIRESESDFPPIHKELAEAESLHIWEERGLSMMLGKIEKCQPAIFQMFMRNKFGWDKENYGQKDTNEPSIKILAKKWRATDE